VPFWSWYTDICRQSEKIASEFSKPSTLKIIRVIRENSGQKEILYEDDWKMIDLKILSDGIKGNFNETYV
jgi:hypothetical protein